MIKKLNDENKLEHSHLALLKNQNSKLSDRILKQNREIAGYVYTMKNRALSCQIFIEELRKEKREYAERLDYLIKIHMLTSEIQKNELS